MVPCSRFQSWGLPGRRRGTNTSAFKSPGGSVAVARHREAAFAAVAFQGQQALPYVASSLRWKKKFSAKPKRRWAFSSSRLTAAGVKLAMMPSRPQFDRRGLRGAEKSKAATVPDSPMLAE